LANCQGFKNKISNKKVMINHSNEIQQFDFYGLKISSFNEDSLIMFFEETIENRKKAICYGYSLGSIPYFKHYPEYLEYANQFDIMACDGRGIYLLAKWMGFQVKSDLSIPNMTWKLLELANKNGYSVLIIGSSPENNKKATENARIKYPGAKFYNGADGGKFSPQDQQKTAEYINEVKPDILLIGVSSPKKESFAYYWQDKIDVKIIIPFGGAIDILSGKSKPIPKIVKKMCLGAYYRFIQEPKRLFRDSILFTGSVMLKVIPRLVFLKMIGKDESFSIPKLYNKSIDTTIK
jgi:N-acetylglucosaminyldiphosphoundecaprenol N-acetyl-beta-D-mannosaminyltransferase